MLVVQGVGSGGGGGGGGVGRGYYLQAEIFLNKLRLNFTHRIFRPFIAVSWTSKQENGENYIMRSLGIFTPYPILCGR